MQAAGGRLLFGFTDSRDSLSAARLLGALGTVSRAWLNNLVDFILNHSRARRY